MYTLGYSFRPWAGTQAIADGDSIREYIEATVADEGLAPRIRLNHRVVSAEWSSDTALWTVTAVRTADGEYQQGWAASSDGAVTFTCSFLSVCSGYYRYDEGFTPPIEGADTFGGTIVHPQQWPAGLDYEGKQVVIIGSGATAVTLVPAMAKSAAKVTMLQRSPTYMAPVPSRDRLADRLRGKVPPQLAHDVVRAKNILFSMFTYQLSRRRPETMKAILRKAAIAKLPAGFPVETHLAPSYQPWDQRLCAIPNGDLYRAISAGTADIVTDRISRITPDGIDLVSGTTVPADVIVTATGLNLLVIGGMTLTVDGEPVDLGKTLTYKGMMLEGVPNFALTIGYTNQRVLDPQSGPGCRLHLQVAEVPGPSEPAVGGPRSTGRRRGRRTGVADRSEGRLHPARRQRPAPAGRPLAVAAAPELPARLRPAQSRKADRPGSIWPARAAGAGVRTADPGRAPGSP
jgi:cation diffusion facilitator CzcD-associated flavoprotein CzcO